MGPRASINVLQVCGNLRCSAAGLKGRVLPSPPRLGEAHRADGARARGGPLLHGGRLISMRPRRDSEGRLCVGPWRTKHVTVARSPSMDHLAAGPLRSRRIMTFCGASGAEAPRRCTRHKWQRCTLPSAAAVVDRDGAENERPWLDRRLLARSIELHDPACRLGP
jgi:hypothetical protein